MKHFLLGTCGLLMLACSSHAAPPKMSNKASDIAKAKIDAPGIKVGEMVGRKAIGEKYRLWLSFNPTDVNDPLFPGRQGANRNDDHSFECFGSLKLNGATLWQIPRKSAKASFARATHRDLPEPLKVNPQRQGYSLNKDPQNPGATKEFNFETSDTNLAQNIVHLSLKLSDLDDPTFFDAEPGELNGLDRSDDVFGDYSLDLDFSRGKMGEGHYYWFWQGQDDSGNAVGSNLFLFAEHVGTVYEPRGMRVDPRLRIPKIAGKVIPGKVPSPGPVSKRGR